MSWVQSVIGSVADTISARINYQGIDLAGAASGAGYSRGVSTLENSGPNKADYQPYMNAGNSAANALNQAQTTHQIMGVNSPGNNNFQFSTSGANADPSYQWRLNQGLAGVNASAAAGGGYFSGATGQALNNYAQGAASQEYQNQFNRYQTSYENQLGAFQDMYGDVSNTANLGLGATNQYTNANMNNATNLASMYVSQGQDSAATWLAKYQNVANANTKIADRWSGNNMFSGMSSGGGYGGTGGGGMSGGGGGM